MDEGRQTLWSPPFMSVWLVYQSAWCAVSGRLDQLLLFVEALDWHARAVTADDFLVGDANVECFAREREAGCPQSYPAIAAPHPAAMLADVLHKIAGARANFVRERQRSAQALNLFGVVECGSVVAHERLVQLR